MTTSDKQHLGDDDVSPAPDAPTEPADGPAPASAAEEPTPEARIATLEAEKGEMRERMLRIAADFDNWKKRARREQADAEVKGKESLLRDILEVADNLDRALGSMGDKPEAQSIKEGVTLVSRLFAQKLERNDVKVVEAKGKPFDPRLHEAVARNPTADVPAGTVIEELQRGYMLGDRLIRPALVVVAVAPPSAQPADGAAQPVGSAAGPRTNGDGSGGDGGATEH